MEEYFWKLNIAVNDELKLELGEFLKNKKGWIPTKNYLWESNN